MVVMSVYSIYGSNVFGLRDPLEILKSMEYRTPPAMTPTNNAANMLPKIDNLSLHYFIRCLDVVKFSF